MSHMSQGDRRFDSRARALCIVRIPFLLGALLLWASPSARTALGLSHPLLPVSIGVAFASALLHALSRAWISPAAWARLTYASICVDAATFAVWAVGTGGLRSPLLPIQLLITGFSVLLFPRPIHALPAVAALASIAWLERLVPGRHLYDLTVLSIYGSLHLALAYLLTYLDRRERALRQERDRLVRDLGAAEERARVSREMHDGLGGSLAAIVYQAQILEGQCPDEASREQSRLLLDTASEALDELRRSLHVLRSEFDLPTAVRDHCERFSRRAKLPVMVRVEGEAAALPAEAQLSLFRVLQEALHNVWRHAEARSVEVVLSQSEERALLCVRDDGVGFVPSRRRSGSYGMTSLRERAERVGGKVEIESAPGRGTEVRFFVFRPREEASA